MCVHRDVDMRVVSRVRSSVFKWSVTGSSWCNGAALAWFLVT